ncbi:uncharacterized protein LOC141853789 isoform X2 [Brevipalpus obovatus]|uniref:uncharacterized protein LOC141853789 isoform X2 n=1 Tax=Brevipalpus obovatus TaxID=246614 RepID=UPI003D9FA49F
MVIMMPSAKETSRNASSLVAGKRKLGFLINDIVGENKGGKCLKITTQRETCDDDDIDVGGGDDDDSLASSSSTLPASATSPPPAHQSSWPPTASTYVMKPSIDCSSTKASSLIPSISIPTQTTVTESPSSTKQSSLSSSTFAQPIEQSVIKHGNNSFESSSPSSPHSSQRNTDNSLALPHSTSIQHNFDSLPSNSHHPQIQGISSAHIVDSMIKGSHLTASPHHLQHQSLHCNQTEAAFAAAATLSHSPYFALGSRIPLEYQNPYHHWLLTRHSPMSLQASFGNPLSAYMFHNRKVKRMRTAFNPQQLIELERAFEKNHYVVGTERKQLAEKLGLSETQVKVWFQNRRTKFKRQKQESETSERDEEFEDDDSASLRIDKSCGSLSQINRNEEESDEDDLEDEMDTEDEDKLVNTSSRQHDDGCSSANQTIKRISPLVNHSISQNSNHHQGKSDHLERNMSEKDGSNGMYSYLSTPLRAIESARKLAS